MSELIEDYLSNLESRLSHKLPKIEVAEHVKEVRSHISESVSCLQIEGETHPDVIAVKRLGPDRLLAENLVRAKRGLDTRSSWRFIVLPAICLAVFGAGVEIVNLNDSTPLSVETSLTWLPGIFLALVSLAVIRSRRLLIGPLAATFATFVLGITTVESVWGPFGISSYSAERRKEEVVGFQRYISELETKEIAGKQVMAGNAFSPSLKEGLSFLAPRPVQGQSVMHDPIRLTKTTTSYPMALLVSVPTEKEAQSLWSNHGQAYFTWSDGQLSEQRDLMSHWTGEKIFPHPLTIAKNILMSGLYGMVVVFAFCFLSLGLVRARERVINLAWKPERIRA